MLCYNICKMRTQTMIHNTMAKLTAQYVNKSFNHMSCGENTSNCYIINSTNLNVHFVRDCFQMQENCTITNDIIMKKRHIVTYARKSSSTNIRCKYTWLRTKTINHSYASFADSRQSIRPI